MSLRSTVVRVFSATLIVVSLNVVALPDTIRLKDGSIIKGKITGFAGGKFTVSMGGGTRRRQMTFAAGDIESISFEEPQDQVAIVPAADRGYPSVKPAQREPIAAPVEKDPVVSEEKVEEEPAEVVVSTPDPTPAKVTPTKRASFGKPIELAVKVLADNTANGWTNSGWVVKKGQRIRISGTGQVSIGRGKTTGPSGLYDVEDNDKLLKSVPTGALIAVIGDDNNEFIYIGSEREFTASRDGALFLGLNEGNLNDNTGSFEVKVEISPDSGE